MEQVKDRIKIAICDSDQAMNEAVVKQLKRTLQMMGIIDCKPDIYHCGTNLLKSEKEYHVVLLDVKMPEIDGFDVAQCLNERKRSPFMIFLTTYKELIPKGYHVGAYRFLMKPIVEEDFNEAISSAINELMSAEIMSINSDGKLIVLYLNEIVHIEALGHGCCIHTEDSHFLVKEPLKYWTAYLPGHLFVETHKSHLVSLEHVKEVHAKAVYLKTSKKVDLAARRVKQVKDSVYRFIRFKEIK